ncbi:HNH endonuclease signature motif containing protein [Arthrobacter sp. FW306-06-A]|uniref:HNH endonuclease signature motif containing protein n=1 Tax=Arthrobacter sp. FW306-06-A TaxID=2879621 RepID=UPI001F3B9F51|nr:HNH endonuclease signature motif containing protein [Arthrobacter sp. FW306-06-A]UKA71688.1 HNH endonuclease [Arthrobacter sp. FW306-06-A]
MGVGSGVGVALEGIQASVAALDALTALGALDAISALEREDAFLASGVGVGSGVDVLQRRYEIRLERLGLTARLEAQLAAMKARDAAEAIGFQQAMTPPDASIQDHTYAEMSVVEEIAGVLTISSAAAGALVEQSRKICSLPPVFQALATGAMSWQHARIVADETEGLDPAGAAALVAHFFDPDAPHPARGATPGELVPSRFRAKVRAWRERHHPETLQKRHAKGVADRRMEYTPDRDGMAWVSLYLPGDTACAIWNRTTATARGLQGPNEPRTITQLRPDIAASLLLGSASEPGKVPTPRADVLVTVPVLSLLGLTDEPATLDGLGPIPASMARKLVADGADSFYRVLVDPRDGAPLEIGRKNYRLTETIKRWIRMRDAKCTFPGCTNRTPDNDTDHLRAWEHGGTTGAGNLAQLCPKHHRLKHHTQWTPDPATNNDSPGWTSPTGRHYKPEHPHPEPTYWPQWLMPTELRSSDTLSLDARCKDARCTDAKCHDAGCIDVPCLNIRCLEAGPEDLPLWEPDDDNFIDPDDLSPDDPLWAELLATPLVPSG